MQDDSDEKELAAALEVRMLRLGVSSISDGGDIPMRMIRRITHRFPTAIRLCSPPAAVRRWKAVLFGAMLLLSMQLLASSGSGLGPTLATEQVLARMEQRYERQLQALESYQARRRYSVAHTLLGKPAYLVVEEQYRAPEEKRFRVLERGGSSEVQERVFSRLLEVERETTRELTRRQVDLCRRNYQFTLEQYDPAARAYIFAVEPRSPNPYLLRGKIWINDQDFAVQRIEGEPVRRHSVFVRQTRFVHEFARFGEFWFPVRHHSETDLRLFGRAVLDISYFDYHWQIQKEAQP